MKTKEQKIIENIARSFNCVDVDELSNLESDIVMLLTEAGYLDMDKVHTEDGDYLYSELYATIDM